VAAHRAQQHPTPQLRIAAAVVADILAAAAAADMPAAVAAADMPAAVADTGNL
jgi:hypothetical protein